VLIAVRSPPRISREERVRPPLRRMGAGGISTVPKTVGMVDASWSVTEIEWGHERVWHQGNINCLLLRGWCQVRECMLFFLARILAHIACSVA